jgi:hypothetical protein
MTTTTDVAASAVAAISNAASVTQPVLTQALANLINKTVEAAQAGGQFLVEQVPDVIRQLLLYKAVESGLLCAFGLTMLVTGITGILFTRNKFLSKVKGWTDRYGDGYSDWACLINVVSVCLILAGAIVTFINWDWLEILLAPKLYLIEYATSLLQALRNGGS